MIVKEGDKWCVKSEDGSRGFGCYDSEAAAKKRLREVEAFKHMDTKQRHQRFDRGRVSKVTRTQQGFLRVDAAIARVGVLLYHNPDGSERRELRPADEVFDPLSLGSFAHAPVTDLHPDRMVGPDNVRELQRGIVGESVRKDGSFVAAQLLIQDGELIAAVEKGERREVSCGYTCFLDETPGTHQGEKYDAIQRAILANHVAIGPGGWGRSGPDVSLRMDGRMDGVALGDYVRQRLELMGKSVDELAASMGADRWAMDSFLAGWWDSLNGPNERATGKVKRSQLDTLAKFLDQPVSKLEALVPMSERQDKTHEPRKATMEPITIRIDGIEYKVDASAGPHIVREIEKRDGALKVAADAAIAQKASADRLQAQVDALTGECDALKARVDAATAPAAIEAAVKARLAVVDKARSILGAEEVMDGKSDQEIKIACITRSNDKFDAAGKSSEYIDAWFDAIRIDDEVARQKVNVAVALTGNRNDAAGAGNTPTEGPRDRMMRLQRERGIVPLAAK